MAKVISSGHLPKKKGTESHSEMETIRKSVTVTKELNKLIEIGAAMHGMTGQQYIVLLLELGIPQQIRDLVETVVEDNLTNTKK